MKSVKLVTDLLSLKILVSLIVLLKIMNLFVQVILST